MLLPAGKGGENTFFLQGSLSTLDWTVVAQSFLTIFRSLFYFKPQGWVVDQVITGALKVC